MEVKCPKCGSKRINQYRMPTGAIWCDDCGHRVEEKEYDQSFFGLPNIPKPSTIELSNLNSNELLMRASMKLGSMISDPDICSRKRTSLEIVDILQEIQKLLEKA